MKKLNNYIIEKLKIRKTKENTIDTLYIGIYNAENIMDALDETFGRNNHNIKLYNNTIEQNDDNFCSVKYKHDTDLIKLCAFIELMWGVCMYNGEENNSEDIGHYLQDKDTVTYIGKEYQNEIEETINTYENNFHKMYRELLRPIKLKHRGTKLCSVNNNMKH